MVVTNKSNTNNQYQTIKLRLHGCNSSCTIPNVIPNTAKLKVVIVALINNSLNFLSYVYLQYKSINVYKDKKAINTPTQDNNQSPSPLTNINRNQHIPAAEKIKERSMFFNTGFILFSHPHKNLNINYIFYLHDTRNGLITFSFYIDEVKITSKKNSTSNTLLRLPFYIGRDIKK